MGDDYYKKLFLGDWFIREEETDKKPKEIKWTRHGAYEPDRVTVMVGDENITGLIDGEPFSVERNKTNKTNKGEENMSNTNIHRRVVNFALIDEDCNVPVEGSLVVKFQDIVTEDSNEATIQSLLLDPKNKVAEKIADHNERRENTINKTILNNTGNKVMLLPIKIKDLTWKVQ